MSVAVELAVLDPVEAGAVVPLPVAVAPLPVELPFGVITSVKEVIFVLAGADAVDVISDVDTADEVPDFVGEPMGGFPPI